jgi:hypothetical protein
MPRKIMDRYNFEAKKVVYHAEPESQECGPHHPVKKHGMEPQRRDSWFTAFGSSRALCASNASKKKHQQSHHCLRHSTQVARQGFWFCGAFYMTWLFPTITRLVQVVSQTTPFPLIFISAIFVPTIQGFFNFLVYIHPRVMERTRSRAAHSAWKSERNEGHTESNNNKDSMNSNTLSISDRQRPYHSGEDDCLHDSLGSIGNLDKTKEEDENMDEFATIPSGR